MVPFLFAQSNGIGVVSGDNLNTFVQGGCLLANLQAFTGLPNMTVYLIGLNAPGDGGQGTFYWNPSWTGTPDNANQIQPYGVFTGAWLRLPIAANGVNGALRTAQSATNDTMVIGDGVIIWNQAGAGTRNQLLLSAGAMQNNYRVTVKDGYGDSAANNIVITAAGGTIDGSSSTTINVRKGSLTFAANNLANDWTII